MGSTLEISIAGEARSVESAMNEVVGASTITGAGHGPPYTLLAVVQKSVLPPIICRYKNIKFIAASACI
jgi:hypothetical protein